MNRSSRFVLPPLLLLTAAMLTLASLVATHERPDTMTSNYRQAIYDIPYSGLVPPSIVGALPLDDDFSNPRPQKFISGTLFPGYAELAPKWKIFDPGPVIDFAGVDTRLQMALLTGAPSKAWGGIYQDLPDAFIPTVVGQGASVTIYLRSTLAFIDNNVDAYAGLKYGLLLGQDLTGSPSTSPIIAAHASLTRAPDPLDSAPAVNGFVQASSFASFDGAALPAGRSYAWPASAYTRIRLDQAMNGIGDFSFQWSADTAAYGNDWTTLFNAVQVTGQPAPWKSVGFGINGDGNAFGVYFDFFRVMAQSIGDNIRTIGGTQQLGAV
jgi:hypothetical protein